MRTTISGTYTALDKSVSRVGGLIIAAGLLSAVATIAAFKLDLSYIVSFVIVFSFTSLTVAACALFIRVPETKILDQRVASALDELVQLRDQIGTLRRSVEEFESKYASAATRLTAIQRIYNSRLNRLLITPWQSLTGIPFEQFLGDVFEELGYAVETTKASGDQGVDLVATRSPSRIAVQAKGYPGSTVGNGAVQEVYAGKQFYNCNLAIVITNSTFTRSARELAQHVGVILLDGSQIPSLIAGKLVLQ